MYHIIGDIHATSFVGIPDVEVYYLPSNVSAKDVWKENSFITDIIKNAPKGDKFFLSVGEVDCRINIYEQSMKYCYYPYLIIDNIVTNYVNYVNSLNILRDNEVYILTVPPQGPAKNPGTIYYTDREIRQTYTESFNIALQTKLPNKTVNIWPNFELWPEEDFNKDKITIKKEVIQKLWEKYIKSNNTNLKHTKIVAELEKLNMYINAEINDAFNLFGIEYI